MTTADLIESMRQDLKRELREEILSDLLPLVEKKLHSNLFSLREAAKYLGLSESTLRRMMVGDGEVPFFKQRGQFFFRQSDLDRWIDSQITKSNG